MKVKKYTFKIFALLLIFIVSFFFNAFADDAAATYKDAIKYLKSGKEEWAFAKFLHIVQWNKESKYRDEALFRVAEHYVKSEASFDAEKALKEHSKQYPDSSFKDKIIAYLYEIKSKQGDDYYNKGEWQEALNYYEKALLYGKNNSDLNRKMQECRVSIFQTKSQELIEEGNILYQNEEWAKALKAYSKALEVYSVKDSIKEKINDCTKLVEFEKKQREKGLRKFNGKWITFDELKAKQADLLDSIVYEYERIFRIGPSYLYEYIPPTSYLNEYIPPGGESIEKERRFKKSYDKVWEAIISLFASTNTSIKTIEKSSGIIVAERTIDRSSNIKEFVDIGYMLETERYVNEIYTCANWNLREDSNYSYETIKTRCRLKETRNEDATYRKNLDITIITAYNIYAKKTGKQTNVKVNIDFSAWDSALGKIEKLRSTGTMEKILLDYIDNYIDK